jgi:hypothetical protein
MELMDEPGQSAGFAKFRREGALLVADLFGPCAPAALEGIRDDIPQRRNDGLVGVAWVADASIEGRRVMEPIVAELYAGIVPIQFFCTRPPADRWLGSLLQLPELQPSR